MLDIPQAATQLSQLCELSVNGCVDDDGAPYEVQLVVGWSCMRCLQSLHIAGSVIIVLYFFNFLNVPCLQEIDVQVSIGSVLMC